MTNHRILVAEDDPDISRLLSRQLEANGFDVVVAHDGREALESFRKQNFKVVLADLYMPEIPGDKLVDELIKTGLDPVIIMLSGENEVSKLSALFKAGIYSYIQKPFKSEELLFQVERAFEHAELIRMRKALEMEREIRLEQQLSWHDWKEQMISRDRDRVEGTLFSNLNLNFSQGAGFGALISLISFIPEMAEKKENGEYVLDADMAELLFENARKGNETLAVFGELDKLIQKELPLTEMPATAILNILDSAAADVEAFAAEKNQTLQLAHGKYDLSDRKLALNTEYITKAFRELFINAFKFSEAGTDILVLHKIYLSRLTISVMNVPITVGDVQGIPPEYENLVFEPFYRIVKSVDERYATLDHGLGLTITEKIVRKHGGKIHAANVTDYLDFSRKPRVRVNFEIQLPFVD